MKEHGWFFKEDLGLQLTNYFSESIYRVFSAKNQKSVSWLDTLDMDKQKLINIT